MRAELRTQSIDVRRRLRVGLALLLVLGAGCDCSPQLPERFACLVDADCIEGYVCSASECRKIDGGVVRDAGFDAGTDAGNDAGTDAGVDSGFSDAGADAGTDGGRDGGLDAGNALGTSCSDAGTCASGYCANGVCCNGPCQGACDLCNTTGSMGQCLPASGTYAGNPPCAPYLCNGSASTCISSCSVSAGCIATSYCAAPACVPKKANGQSCTLSEECIGGCSENNLCIGKMSGFQDDFDDNALNTAKWGSYAGPGAQVFERNGRVEIELAVRDAGYAGLYSVNTYDFYGSTATVELKKAGNQTLAQHDAYFTVSRGSNDELGFDVTQNVLYAVVKVGGVQMSIASTPYLPSQMRYFRFRENAGVVIWEISDGGAYQMFASRTAPFPLNGLRFGVGGGTSVPEDAGSSDAWDNANINVP